MAQCLTKWLPPPLPTDCPFYPAGLLLHGSDAKSVLLLWSPNVIKTLIFRGLSESLHKDLPPTKSHLLPLPSSTNLSHVVVGTSESFLVTSTGSILSFRTAKQLQTIPHLSGVQCACSMKNGFAMVRLSPDTASMFVHIQQENFSPEENEGWSKQFDISSEANSCQSTWADTAFCLKEIEISVDNPQLFAALRNRNDDSSAIDSFLLLSINSNLLSLVWGSAGGEDDFQLHLVQTFESTIVNMWLSEAGEALFVQLQSGSLDVLHCCRLTQIGLRRSKLFIGDRVDCFQVFQDMVVYSNGTHVVQSKIMYDEPSDTYSLMVLQRTSVFGVVAITMAVSENLILAVTENNLMYKIKSQANVSTRSEDLTINSIMCVVDDCFVSAAKQDLASIVQLTETFEEVRSELLERNYDSRLMEIVSSSGNQLMPFEVSLTAEGSSMPVGDYTVDLSAVQKVSGDIKLSITLTPRGKSAIDFSQNHWTLSIEEVHHRHRNTVRSIRITESMLHQPLNILIHTSSECDSRLSIPLIRIALNTQTTVGADKLSFKFALATHQLDISNLFTVHPHPPLLQSGVKRRRTSRKPAPNVRYVPRLPFEVPSDDIFKLFGKTTADKSPKSMFINLLGRCVRIAQNEDDDRLLTISSDDATALFYVKEFIWLKLHTLFDFRIRIDSANSSRIRAILEKCQTIPDIGAEQESSRELQGQIVKSILNLRESLAGCFSV